MTDQDKAPLNPQTKSYLLLSLIAISGEIELNQISRLGSKSYLDNVVKFLKRDGLLRTYYKDKYRGLRLTFKAKTRLLADYEERFNFFISGKSETNQPKSELTRRLRLYRIAETIITMNNADIAIFRDIKPNLFSLPHIKRIDINYPCFYTSREMKEAGIDFIKIRGSRMVGLLLTLTKAYIIYNTEKTIMKWSYKEEMRVKALIKNFLCREHLAHQYQGDDIEAIMLASDNQIALDILTGSKKGKHNYFILDGNYEHFHFAPNNHSGEVLLKLLSDDKKQMLLNNILSDNLHAPNPALIFEHDYLNENGLPVLFGYSMDLPRIARFNNALELHQKSGIIICFDFQLEVLRQYCCSGIAFEVINLAKMERGLFNQD